MHACTFLAADSAGSIRGGAVPHAATVFEVLTAGHTERASLQRFIAERYSTAYGAHVGHFARYLAGLRRPGAAWSAGVGYTHAGRDPLFIEQYLDRPIDEEIGARIGSPVAREQVVEVGNLAAVSPGAARLIIVRMTALLHRAHRSWVVFTSTRALLNSFGRLGIDPIFITRADPRRLPDAGASWGSYYQSDPQVVAANIPAGYSALFHGGPSVATRDSGAR